VAVNGGGGAEIGPVAAGTGASFPARGGRGRAVNAAGTVGTTGACAGAASTQLSQRSLAGTGIGWPPAFAPQVIPRVVLLAKGTPAAWRRPCSLTFSPANFPPFATQPRTLAPSLNLWTRMLKLELCSPWAPGGIRATTSSFLILGSKRQ
jgi:hypothetical protein